MRDQFALTKTTSLGHMDYRKSLLSSGSRGRLGQSRRVSAVSGNRTSSGSASTAAAHPLCAQT